MSIPDTDAIWIRNHIFTVKLIKIVALRLGISPEEFDSYFQQAQFQAEAEYLDLRASHGDL